MILDILHGIRDQVLAAGTPTARPPAIYYGLEEAMVLRLYHDDGQATAFTQSELEGYASWKFALDEDYDYDTLPAVLTSAAFSVADNAISFVAATSTDRFLEILAGNPYVDGVAELKGYQAGDTLPSIIIQFPMRLRSTVVDETAVPPVEQQPDFVSATQAEAIAAGKMDSYYPTTTKAAPEDADRLTLWDSAAGLVRKYCTWANLKTAMATAYGLLSTAQKALLTGGGSSDADTLHTHASLATASRVAALEVDQATSPAGTTELGTIYRRTAAGWLLADPDDTECETCELWIALGTDVASDGMRAGNVLLVNPAWNFSASVPGARVWLDDDGAVTATGPDATSDAGRAARPVGWVRDATSIRFDGHMQSLTFEEAAS